MQALILNLDREADRLAWQIEQVTALGLEPVRIAATTPATVTPPVDDTYWSTWERPLRTTEMACLCTHRAAWQHVVDTSAGCLVLEDDAMLEPGISALLQRISTNPVFEHVTFEVRGRQKVMAQAPHPDAPVHRLELDRTGAAAYWLSPTGAARLLARTARRCGLADAVICAAKGLQSWQAVPGMAVQFDCALFYGLTPPFDVASTIDAERRPEDRSLRQRLRRVLSQCRMGVRQWRPGLQCIDVPLGDRPVPAGRWKGGWVSS